MNKHKYRKSRLAKIERQKTLKTVISSFVLVIAIIGVLIYFGVPLLIKLAIFVSETRAPTLSEEIKNQAIIPKPVLDALPEATPSASIKVSGYSQPGLIITLVLNSQKSKQELSDSDGSFQINVNLVKGKNIITVIASDNQDHQSPASNELTVNYDNEPPLLEITSPANNFEFSGSKNKIVDIVGKTEPGGSVTINNRFSLVSSDGAFTSRFELKEGDNQFIAAVHDKAGNETEVDFTLRWRP